MNTEGPRRTALPVKPKPSVAVTENMKLSLTDPEGLFNTVIGGIILLAALFLAYLLLFGTY